MLQTNTETKTPSCTGSHRDCRRSIQTKGMQTSICTLYKLAVMVALYAVDQVLDYSNSSESGRNGLTAIQN